MIYQICIIRGKFTDPRRKVSVPRYHSTERMLPIPPVKAMIDHERNDQRHLIHFLFFHLFIPNFRHIYQELKDECFIEITLMFKQKVNVPFPSIDMCTEKQIRKPFFKLLVDKTIFF